MKKIEKEKFGGAVGDKGFEYYYIGLLGTAPKCQGRGYGSALVNTILSTVRTPIVSMSLPLLILFLQADLKGRPTFLFSSNPDNIPFYESLGFEVIGELKLGENNKKWKKDPVSLPLVGRLLLMTRISLTVLDQRRCFESQRQRVESGLSSVS